MPSIPQKNVDSINNGDDQDMPDRKVLQGYALVKLVEVTETEVKESGFAGQNLKYEVVEPRGVKGTWIWDFISYNPKANFRWRMFFDAFGYEYDSDTDEILEAEDLCVLYVTPQVQTRGKNKGRENTTVEDMLEDNAENRALVDAVDVNEGTDGESQD